ncbi:MAG: HEPN domain-containing protein [Chloroflexi bacterium]|nr:HEPN domain-containing protein [Chloroflexota bacterium]
MSERDPEIKKKIGTILSRSRESMLIARHLHDEGHYNDAVSRAYYGSFHALQAVLLSRGLSFSKHSGVLAAFNREFVLSGLFAKDFSQKISRLYRDRLTGDYEYEEPLGEEQSMRDLAASEEVVGAIEGYLKKEGFVEG